MYKKVFSSFIVIAMLAISSAYQAKADNLAGNVNNFIAFTGDQFTILEWNNPDSNDFAGTMLVRSSKSISWTPSDGVIYTFGEVVAPNTIIVYYSTGETYDDNSLTNGETYYYKTFTVDYEVDYSTGSNEIFATPENDNISPNKPSNLTGISNDTSITLSWIFSDSTDVKNYHLICQPDNNYSSIFETYTTNNTHQFNNVEKNIEYTCQVTAIDYSDNISEPSNSITIQLNNGSGGDDSGGNGSGGNDSGGDDFGGNGSGGDDSGGDDFGGNGSGGDDSGGDNISNISSLDPPFNLKATTAHLSVKLNWEILNLNLITGFNVYKKCSSDNEYFKANIQLIFDTNYVVTNLIENDQCNLYATAIDLNLLETIPSNISTVQIVSDTIQPTQIKNVEIVTGNNQIFINWDEVQDNDLAGYLIYLNGSSISDELISSPPFTLVNIKNNRENIIEIRSVDTAGNESSYETYEVTAPESHPYTGKASSTETLLLSSLLSKFSMNLNNDGLPIISLDNSSGSGDNDDDSDFWNSNNEIANIQSLAGFNIYRGTNIMNLQKINTTSLINTIPYIDNNTSSQTTYYYQVAGVSLDGSESKRSNIISIKSKDAQNTGYFLDVPPSHIFFEYIENLRTNRIVQGYDGHIYKPNQSITRIEALKIILKTRGIITDKSLRFHDYADIDSNNWYSEYVQTASQESIVKGYNDGFFRPTKNVTRIEFLKMVMKTAGIKNTKNSYSTFYDLENNFWGTDYANKAQELKIISGYSDGNFKPNKDITRAEAAKIVSYLLRK